MSSLPLEVMDIEDWEVRRRLGCDMLVVAYLILYDSLCNIMITNIWYYVVSHECQRVWTAADGSSIPPVASQIQGSGRMMDDIYMCELFCLKYLTKAICVPIPKGRIVNNSSLAGFAHPAFIGAYATSKSALNTIGDVLRVELEPFGTEYCVLM